MEADRRVIYNDDGKTIPEVPDWVGRSNTGAPAGVACLRALTKPSPFAYGPRTSAVRLAFRQDWSQCTSHEPAYAEDGRPGLRYRLHHEEKAGIALTMIGGSAVVARELAARIRQYAAVRRAHRDDLQALALGVRAHGAATPRSMMPCA